MTQKSKSPCQPTGGTKQETRVEDMIPYLSPDVQAAIARGHWSKALSLECDRPITQAETRFHLEFLGVRS
jgi:hypothetical protein